MITLTFDDALLNTYEVAFPILEKHGIKAVYYIPTGIISGEIKRFRTDNAPHMSLEQVKELYNAGWKVGSHSVTHPRFDLITLEKAEWELKESKKYLQSHGFNPQSFAFPYGHGHYTQQQIFLAHEYYRRVRTVSDQKEGLINSIPLDRFPPTEHSDVYVIHLIKETQNFKSWVERLR